MLLAWLAPLPESEAQGPVHVPRPPIVIEGNDDLHLGPLPNAANGVVRGSGTPSDPWVIEGWLLLPLPGGSSGIYVANVSEPLLIRDNSAVGHRVSAQDARLVDGHAKSTRVTKTGAGVKLVNVSNLQVVDNLLSGNAFGLVHYRTGAAQVHGNDLVANRAGWWLEETQAPVAASGNVLQGNEFSFGVYSFFTEQQGYVHAIDESNTIDGLPIVYLVGASGLSLSPATKPLGFLALVNSAGIEVTGYAFSGNSVSLLLAFASNILVHNVTFTGNQVGTLWWRTNNVVLQDSVVDGNVQGVRLERASDNIVRHNAFGNHTEGPVADGVMLRWDSDRNEVDHNRFGRNQVSVDVLGNAPFGCPEQSRIHDNNFNGSTFEAVFEELTHILTRCDLVAVDAQDNWWGAADGPGSFCDDPALPYTCIPGGDGHGDNVTTFVDYEPFLTAPVPLAGPRP